MSTPAEDSRRPITVQVNGAARELPAGATVADLLRQLGVDPQRPGTAVARNAEVVRRAEWTTTRLRAGDRVEVLGAMQGGAR
jgi:sulfur carrier protein